MPVADLAIVLVGMGTKLSASVMHRLCTADVALLFCDWRGIPEGGAYSWSEHGRVAARHRAQAAMTLPRKKNAWARLVRAKITGQAAVLEILKFLVAASYWLWRIKCVLAIQQMWKPSS